MSEGYTDVPGPESSDGGTEKKKTLIDSLTFRATLIIEPR